MTGKPPDSNEFFYINDKGEKDDTALHNSIINPVDFPIIESIMAPIRARHRAKYDAQQKTKRMAERWLKVKARAEALLASGGPDLYKEWNEQDHPREPAGGPGGGQFAGGGGSDSTGTQAAGESPASLPAAFHRTSPSNAERGRGVVAVWQPTTAASAEITRAGDTPQTFHEYGSKGSDAFHGAISSAKSGAHGAAVTAYPVADYKDMRLFMAPDGKSGFALKGDDIVSLFKHPDSTAKGVADVSLRLAVEQGGRRLDCFDTVLPTIYSDSGFRAVARLAWSDVYAPDGWSKDAFKTFNGGEPDVVFMVHDVEHDKLYAKGDGVRVEDYDAGTAEQQKALDAIRARN